MSGHHMAAEKMPLLGLERKNCYSLVGLKKLSMKRVMDRGLGEVGEVGEECITVCLHV